MNINKFVNTIYFPILIAIFNVISWKIDSFILLTFINLLAVGLMFIFNGNKLNIIMIMFSYLSGNRYENMDFKSVSSILSYICIISTVIICIVYIIKDWKKIKFKNIIIITFSLYLLSGVISLINSPSILISLMRVGILLGSLLAMIYIYSVVDYTKENKDYIMKILIIISFAIISQMTLVYFELYNPEDPFYIIRRKGLKLGWAIGNRYSSILSLSLISTFYFYITREDVKRKLLSCMIMIIQALAILICLSRGAILGMGVAAIPLAISIFIYSKNKKIELISILGVIALTTITIVLLNNITIFEEMFETLLNLDYSDDRGRDPLTELALNQFKLNWFIGNGIGTSKYYITEVLNSTLVHYHNFILQILAEQGIVGITTFGLFGVAIIKTCFKKDACCAIVFCMLMYMMAHGLVDTTFHSPTIIPIFIMIVGFLATSKKESL